MNISSSSFHGPFILVPQRELEFSYFFVIISSLNNEQVLLVLIFEDRCHF